MEQPQIQQQTMQGEQPVKKSKWWIWTIVALVVIGVGVGIYVLFTNPGALISGPGSSIPSPPALPD